MYRKDSIAIGEWIKNSNKALLVTGARQIGKTWLIRDEIEKKRMKIDSNIKYIFVDYLDTTCIRHIHSSQI